MAKQAMVSQFSLELVYNIRHDLSVNNEGSEALWNNKPEIKKIFVLTLFTDSGREIKKIENYFRKFIEKTKTKKTYLLGDFN